MLWLPIALEEPHINVKRNLEYNLIITIGLTQIFDQRHNSHLAFIGDKHAKLVQDVRDIKIHILGFAVHIKRNDKTNLAITANTSMVKKRKPIVYRNEGYVK